MTTCDFPGGGREGPDPPVLPSGSVHEFTDLLIHTHGIRNCLLQTIWTQMHLLMIGAQWLSGRVLDSRPKGCGYEPHRRNCVVVLEQDTFILA